MVVGVPAGGSVEGGAVSVGTSATRVVAGRSQRKSLVVQNLGAAAVYVGGPGVTVAGGMQVPANGSLEVDGLSGDLWAISGTAGQDVRWMGTF